MNVTKNEKNNKTEHKMFALMIIMVINYICKIKMNIFMLFFKICEKRKKEKIVISHNENEHKIKNSRKGIG